MYQQGTKFYMPVKLSGIELSDISSIEFLMKQTKNKNAPTRKTSLWKSDGTGDAFTSTEDIDTIIIPWELSETYNFTGGQTFYLHCRIHLTESDANPPVPIVPLIMDETLFSETEAVT